MAQLTVRNLGRDLVRLLKIRAAQNNRSPETEHRAILETTLRPGPSDFWRLQSFGRKPTGVRRPIALY
jgi:plasmid stability protein